MKKLVKYILASLFLIIIGSGLYLYKLNSLGDEGNELYGYRCTRVNPHLISYKNSFLKFADYLKNPQEYEVEDMKAVFNDYVNGMHEYEIQENLWLEMQYKFVNRWDFKLLMPWYIQKAADYQIKMYEGYRDDARYLNEIADQKGVEDTYTKQEEARAKRDKYSMLYNEIFEQAPELADWRAYIVSKPFPSGCTDENTLIPNTGGVLDDTDSLPQEPTINPNISG